MSLDNEQRLKEGYYEHGEVLCDGCNETVDLSEAEDIQEAAQIWDNHVEERHREASSTGGHDE
jgi:hypothetical protein